MEPLQPDNVENVENRKQHEIQPLWKKLSPLTNRQWKALAVSLGVLLLAGLTALGICYHRLSKQVDKQLANGTFQESLSYYGAPEVLSLGDPADSAEFAAGLRRSGYNITANDGSITLQAPSPVEINFAKGEISSIVDLAHRSRVAQFTLPPELVANTGKARTKRLLVRYSDLPPVLVNAVVSAEDKRFFSHSGLDVLRIIKAVYVDIKEFHKEQGASTISMQLARNLWLERDKRWKRKIAEALITLHLERQLTKQQILEDYCNLVYLGGHGTFGISGFGEGARAYFNKDIRKLNLTEAALLAGLIQRPSYRDPFRYPERAVARRNVVLQRMFKNKYITEEQYQQAILTPLSLTPGTGELTEAQYFLDLAGGEVSNNLEGHAIGALKIYTTVDMRLQRAADQAIAEGMQLVDKALAARRKKGIPAQKPQVALIALDPHTGEVKALSGGRDYALSQLNRVLSKRPPGSVFKPFVYTAALNTAVVGADKIFTPLSTVDDSPTTFVYQNQTYAPGNYRNNFMGTVTLRQALAHSLNNATVELGQMVGFDKVVALAHSAGMNEDIKPTPAVALGAYQVTPFEIARAYTVFANGGVRVQPFFVGAIQNSSGEELFHQRTETKRVLDPRVAFLMVDMLEEVMRSGTAAGARARGFKLPAGGKTGTSHDGWFAGFTSNLLCIVWVGFDDYNELGLEGARSALPIWTQFMMQAARYKQYANAKPFTPPPGVVQSEVDPTTGCPGGAKSYFISGTQSVPQCAPQSVEVLFTADGGTIQRATTLATQQEPVHLPTPEQVPLETPIFPAVETPQPPPPQDVVGSGVQR